MKYNKKTIIAYTLKNPKKALKITQAVKKGLKQYAETFRQLANT